MWGYPLWPFAPLAALMWLQPVADERALRRFAVGFMAVFVAVPLIYAAVELGGPFVRDRPKATQFPGQLLADIVTREWRARYGAPLTMWGAPNLRRITSRSIRPIAPMSSCTASSS